MKNDLGMLMSNANTMHIRISAVCAMQVTNESLLADVSSSVAASEDGYGRELAEENVDAVNIDHMYCNRSPKTHRVQVLHDAMMPVVLGPV